MKKDESVRRIVKAICELHGGRAKLCSKLKIHPNTLTNWLQERHIPIARAYQLAQMSFGRFSFEELTGAKVLKDE